MEEQINLSSSLWALACASIWPTRFIPFSFLFFSSRLPTGYRGGVASLPEHVESNISRRISTPVAPGVARPLPLLDFRGMHLRGLSPILSARRLQTRRPITVSSGSVRTVSRAEPFPSCEIARGGLSIFYFCPVEIFRSSHSVKHIPRRESAIPVVPRSR